jgi:hypothetical protein
LQLALSDGGSGLADFFRNHQRKLDYPHYLRQGWPIGSGRVESEPKTVVNNRLAGRSMRGGSAGRSAACHLRALSLRERNRWGYFWQLA